MEGSGGGNTSRARPPPTCMDLIVSYPSNPARGPAAAPRPPVPPRRLFLFLVSTKEDRGSVRGAPSPPRPKPASLTSHSRPPAR